MPDDLRSPLADQVLVCDGAMGTMLYAAGVSLDRSLPELNLANPDLVRAIHRAYIQVGVDVIQTNTFGASRYRLARHDAEDRAVEINRAGARLAREARDQAERPVLSPAPSDPSRRRTLRGRLNADEARTALRAQIEALVAEPASTSCSSRRLATCASWSTRSASRRRPARCR